MSNLKYLAETANEIAEFKLHVDCDIVDIFDKREGQIIRSASCGSYEVASFIVAANPKTILYLIQQRDELLAALKAALEFTLNGDGLTHEQFSAFNRVIAKAES